MSSVHIKDKSLYDIIHIKGTMHSINQHVQTDVTSTNIKLER